MPGFISDSPLARELISIGDEAIATEDDAKLRAYFREGYVFHGPGGDLSFAELSAYFASLRAAFSNLRIVREQIIAHGNFLAARTAFSGDFTGVFTYSPIGPLEPTGQHLEWEVIGTFRYDDGGRLAEEWVQTKPAAYLTMLGAATVLVQGIACAALGQEPGRAARQEQPAPSRSETGIAADTVINATTCSVGCTRSRAVGPRAWHRQDRAAPCRARSVDIRQFPAARPYFLTVYS